MMEILSEEKLTYRDKLYFIFELSRFIKPEHKFDLLKYDKAGTGVRAKAAGGAERKQGAGGAYDDGPRPHADGDTAEAQRVAGGRVHKGKERDMDFAGVRREAEVFQRSAYVGEGIFRVHCGA